MLSHAPKKKGGKNKSLTSVAQPLAICDKVGYNLNCETKMRHVSPLVGDNFGLLGIREYTLLCTNHVVSQLNTQTDTFSLRLRLCHHRIINIAETYLIQWTLYTSRFYHYGGVFLQSERSQITLFLGLFTHRSTGKTVFKKPR